MVLTRGISSPPANGRLHFKNSRIRNTEYSREEKVSMVRGLALHSSEWKVSCSGCCLPAESQAEHGLPRDHILGIILLSFYSVQFLVEYPQGCFSKSSQNRERDVCKIWRRILSKDCSASFVSIYCGISFGKPFQLETPTVDMEFLVCRNTSNNRFMQVSCKVLLHLNVGWQRTETNDAEYTRDLGALQTIELLFHPITERLRDVETSPLSRLSTHCTEGATIHALEFARYYVRTHTC